MKHEIIERAAELDEQPPSAAALPDTYPMVLHIRVITATGGGPDKTILNSPRYLRQLGYRSVCAFLRGPQDKKFQVIRDRAAAAQAFIEEVDDRGALDWRVLPRLLAVCRRQQVAIWHAHDYKSNLIGILLQRFHPMHLVTTAHGWVEFTPRTRVYHQMDRWSLPRYQKVVCVSEDIYETCRRYGIADQRLVLINNAIDTDDFCRRASSSEAKQWLDWPVGRFLIGAAGRLSPEKGFDLLLESLRSLVDRGHDVGLILAGDGNERESLEQLSRRLGLNDRVRLVGFQSDLRPLYEAMDVFALSSRREGLPNVVLEAMALSTPVVSTRVAGVPRMIVDGENGLLVDIEDQTGLTAALERCLVDPSLRARLATAGRRTIEERYCFARRMEKMARLYDDVLATSEERRR